MYSKVLAGQIGEKLIIQGAHPQQSNDNRATDFAGVTDDDNMIHGIRRILRTDGGDNWNATQAEYNIMAANTWW